MSRLLKIAYTTTDQAVAKGILDRSRPETVALHHNYGNFFDDVLVFVPFGKAELTERLSPRVQYNEAAFTPAGNKIAAGLLHLNRMRRRLDKLVDSFRPDVVQVCGPHLPAMLALSSSKVRALPTVCFLEAYWEDVIGQQGYFPPFVRRMLPYWYRLVYRAFDVYTGAPSLSPAYYSEKGMAENRVARWVQEIDLRMIDAVPASDAPAGLPSMQRPLICFVGRLHPEKLAGDAIEIFHRVVTAGHPGTLVIVGDGTERPRLEEWIKDHEIADRVVFLGQQPLPLTISVMKSCDLMIAPIQGAALIEAMAAELAIVGYDHETHRAHIQDGVNGRLVPHRDIAAAATVLQDLIDRPPERKRLSRAAFDYVHERYSFESVSAIMADGFQKAMNA